MKTIYTPKVRVVTAGSGEEFETKLNAVLEELAEKGRKQELTFNLAAGHCAYIRYEETHMIPETIQDEYELRGECYACRDCPHYVPSMDGRRKWSICDYIGERTTAKSAACEWFYKKLAKGELKPVEL